RSGCSWHRLDLSDVCVVFGRWTRVHRRARFSGRMLVTPDATPRAAGLPFGKHRTGTRVRRLARPPGGSRTTFPRLESACRWQQLPAQIAALLGGGRPPHPVCLTGSQGPPQAFLANSAAAADGLGEFHGFASGAGRTHRKEKLGVVVAARSLPDPVFALVVKAVHQAPPIPGSWL